MKQIDIHPDAIRCSAPSTQPEGKLLCYTLQGQQEHYLVHDVPNKAYLAEVYVCGTSYRDMAQLLDAHLPEEKIAAMAFQSEGVKGWPDTMQGVKPERGVWACKYRHGLSIYRCVNGARIELD